MPVLARLLLFVVAALLAGCASLPAEKSLRNALTFYAPFDGRVDAKFAKGDPRIYTATSMRGREAASSGLPMSEVVRLAHGEGKFGDALKFTRKAGYVFFHGATNIFYARSNWSGAVSFWLSTDPANDLEPGFCDPIQITPRVWNDAAFFVEFEKRQTIPFRLGVYPDFKVWNPANREWASIAPHEKPLVTVEHPPFARSKWTHIAFTWENFNTGKSNGVARLYLDGELRGELGPRAETFTWDAEKTAIAVGLNYIGLFDELAIFNRVLTAEEIASIYRLEKGLGSVAPAR